jgi:tetratricopeptide (TPR) repeat protein
MAVLGSLGIQLYEQTGELQNLINAIGALRLAVNATAPGEPHRAEWLGNLGGALQRQYQESPDLNILQEAVAASRACVSELPAHHPGRRVFLSNLTNVLRVLYERIGQVSLLHEALDAGREAVSIGVHDDPRAGAALNNLRIALQCEFERSRDLDALREAVAVARSAVLTTPESTVQRAEYLSVLGVVLQILFENTEQSATLHEAILVGREAVSISPQDAPTRAQYLDELGSALRLLFEHKYSLDVLEEALTVHREAVAATSHNCRRYATHLNNFSIALQCLFERLGRMDALAEAETTARAAVAAASHSHVDEAECLDTLGNILHMQSRQTGDLDALKEAVSVTRRAVALTPVTHRGYNTSRNNLALMIRHLYERTKQIDVLQDAVQLARDVAKSTPADHPSLAVHLHNLGSVLSELFDADGQINALEEAVVTVRAAIHATPRDHPDHSRRLYNLSLVLQRLFKQTRQSDVLHEAIDVGRRAALATPPDHPSYAMFMAGLADTLNIEYWNLSRDPQLLAEARACYRKAAENEANEKVYRIIAYRRLALLAAETGDENGSLCAIEMAIDLLETLPLGSLHREDRQFQAGRLTNFAGEAAAAALAAGKPARAVELLERTRGILTADALSIRNPDHIRLREHNPGLADRLEKARADIKALERARSSRRANVAIDSLHVTSATQTVAAEQRAADAVYRNLLKEIRGLPRFEDYLTPRIERLAEIPHAGPIVVVNTSLTRCDALIITDILDQPVHIVPLTDITQESALANVNRFLDARAVAVDNRRDPVERMAAQREIHTVLAWLWDTITEPVLIHLGCTSSPTAGQEWPRLWWCAVGGLAYLPFHAAGYHTDDPNSPTRRTVLDRVVSSYTTTLRVLEPPDYRSRVSGAPKPLVISVPNTPGAALWGVTRETQGISGLISGVRVLNQPTRDDVLKALPHHDVVHFACHGHVDTVIPSRSALILHDYADEPLTVADIGDLHLSGELAFLSACDTAVTAPDLADEALHLTGAFQLAGFRQVIGTLWPVDDQIASGLAIDFYSHITNNGTTPPEVNRSADALHHIVRSLRDRYQNSPTLWASHIHVGQGRVARKDLTSRLSRNLT